MALWQSVLEKVVIRTESILERTETRWAVIGSAATALQGADLRPQDIDLLAMEPAGVYRFVELMDAYTPVKREVTASDDEWLSTREKPIREGTDELGYYWHFCRWYVDGVKVEMAHIELPEEMPTSADGAGIWEAGPEIWPYIRQVSFRDWLVLVVPLEIQLETCLQRELLERAKAIARVLQREGVDRRLLQRALHTRNLARAASLLGGAGTISGKPFYN